MNILYVGDLWSGSTALQRLLALRDLGHTLVEVETVSPSRKAESLLPIRAMARFGYSLDVTDANRQILKHTETTRFDALWIDKGLTISSKTLLTVRGKQPWCKIVAYSPDDMMNVRNQSRRYLDCVPLYDLHVTTKTYNRDELIAIGARDVFVVWKGFDPHTHRPIMLTPADRERWSADVGFIGGYEAERYQMMRALADSGVQVTIRCYDDDWTKLKLDAHPNLIIRMEEIWGENYAKGIAATKINLGFLRKANRDLHTARSIEIPACGAFLLAERTAEHLSLFDEEREAEFFDGVDELIKKVHFYLSHEERRLEIARRGLARCRTSGYSNIQRLDQVLAHLSQGPRAANEKTTLEMIS